jgi:hypothetical protein
LRGRGSMGWVRTGLRLMPVRGDNTPLVASERCMGHPPTIIQD